MKQIAHIVLLSLIITACSGTKKISEEKPANDIVIHDTMEIPEKTEGVSVGTGTKVTKTIPVRDMPTTPAEDIPADEQIEVNPQQVNPPVAPVIKDVPEEIITEPVFDQNTVHNPWNELLKNNVAADGIVNYSGFNRNREALRNYISSLGENMPNNTWTQEEKLSFWMNAYNAMTVDLILRNMPLESIKDIKDPWNQRLWKLSEKWYNLDEIEHQILRKMGDARIHFGINCASFSCPPLLNEAFNYFEVDSQLDFLAKRFINDTSRNTITKDAIEISKIFTWFSKDFKQNGSIIDYLNTYSNIKIDNGARVRYMDYNWELNNK